MLSVHYGPLAGNDETIAYSYNGDDELTSQTSSLSGTTTNMYDANGSLTSSADSNNTPVGAGTDVYAGNDPGNVANVPLPVDLKWSDQVSGSSDGGWVGTDADGNVFTLVPDVSDNLATLYINGGNGDGGSATIGGVIVQSDGELNFSSAYDDTPDSFGADNFGFSAQTLSDGGPGTGGSGPGGSWSGYNGGGESNGGGSAIVSVYTYDSRNKMVGYSNSTTTATYVYDDAGNRVQETVNGTTTYYLTDTQNPTGYAQPLEQTDAPGNTPSMTCSVSTLLQTTIRSWTRVFNRISCFRVSAVLPRSSEPRFRFIMLLTVSTCQRFV